MEIDQKVFFLGLPLGKTTGFCEPVQESLDGGAVVNITEDCEPGRCAIGECHMFQAEIDTQGTITARVFVHHQPRYIII